MILSQTTEYALRVMAELALQGPSRSVSREELAKKTHIPVHFLAKILRRLATARLVSAKRGAGGGFLLGRAPERIRFADVLKATGFRFDVDRCAFGWPSCDETAPCPLHPAWKTIKESFHRWAETTTIRDVGRRTP